MPTGYTSSIYNGNKVTFRDYALGCARAFGALVMMRGEPSDAKIPKKFQPSKYHTRKVADARKVLARATNWTLAESKNRAEAKFKGELAAYHRAMKENEARRTRYESMRLKAEAWAPPTKDHDGLKKFMIEQIDTSMDGDCYAPELPTLQNPIAFKMDVIENAKHDIRYHEAEQIKENERVKSRSGWVKCLLQSLPK